MALNATSESDPIRVDFAPLPSNIPGRLGMTFAPGKKQSRKFTNTNWKRDLDADLTTLAQEYKTSVLLSLLQDYEYDFVKIEDLPNKLQQKGIQHIKFPIPDSHTPDEEEIEKYWHLIEQTIYQLMEGQTVVVHCMGGLGRTGTVAASVILAIDGSEGSMTGDEAIKLIRGARKGAIQSYKQIEFVRSFKKKFFSWKLKNTTPS